jgi:hypothetical protein
MLKTLQHPLAAFQLNVDSRRSSLAKWLTRNFLCVLATVDNNFILLTLGAWRARHFKSGCRDGVERKEPKGRMEQGCACAVGEKRAHNPSVSWLWLPNKYKHFLRMFGWKWHKWHNLFIEKSYREIGWFIKNWNCIFATPGEVRGAAARGVVVLLPRRDSHPDVLAASDRSVGSSTENVNITLHTRTSSNGFPFFVLFGLNFVPCKIASRGWGRCCVTGEEVNGKIQEFK